MEISPEVEFETNVGIHANDWRGFEEGLAEVEIIETTRGKYSYTISRKSNSNIMNILLRDFHRIGMPTSASSDSDSRTG